MNLFKTPCEIKIPEMYLVSVCLYFCHKLLLCIHVVIMSQFYSFFRAHLAITYQNA
nr:MAG TPA: hypothetical protein [Caudoviricetes sp.]